MRYGFTTGSCAAAAAKAAAYMLLTGQQKTQITIMTPRGIPFTAQLCDISRAERMVCCAVKKDGGDDPDVTSGALIYATVCLQDAHTASGEPEILLTGGKGVGIVTKPGLDQPVGAAAINRIPRKMIADEVAQVCRLADYRGSLHVEIFVPDGEALAAQTFNPRLGIVGGISILGTSGIVEPMSAQALLDTIRVELSQRRALGFSYVAVAPGNYGWDFLKHTYHYDIDRSIKCSNFIGKTIDFAVELGFERLLLTGHIGKLIKVAGGIMNTHSRESDSRIELLTAFALRAQMSAARVQQLDRCVTTEEALALLSDSEQFPQMMQLIVERICAYLEKRACGRLQVDCLLYANAFGELARSKGVEQWFILLEQELARPI